MNHIRCAVPFSTLPCQVEFELSAHDHGEEPPDSAKESMIPTMEPYVPPTTKKVPRRIIKIHHTTIRRHLKVGVSFQLSYNHIPAYGWKVKNVARSAPMRATRPEKTGIALAMIYAVRVIPNVEESHVIQCIALLAVR